MINSDDQELRAYVTLAHSDYIRIDIFDDAIRELLEKRGYCYVEENTWEKDMNEEEKIAEMAYLRDIGIPFSAGPGWPPADIFEYFYKKIGWSGPGKYTITEHYRDSRIPPWKKD